MRRTRLRQTRRGEQLALRNLRRDVRSLHVDHRRGRSKERVFLRLFGSLGSRFLGFTKRAGLLVCDPARFAFARIKEGSQLALHGLHHIVASFDQRLVSAVDLPASLKVRALFGVALAVDLLRQLAAIPDMIADELSVGVSDFGVLLSIGLEARQRFLVALDVRA